MTKIKRDNLTISDLHEQIDLPEECKSRNRHHIVSKLVFTNVLVLSLISNHNS